jgi:hypothetical protein
MPKEKSKPKIEEGHTTQWSKEKGQKDKQQPRRVHILFTLFVFDWV